VPARLAARHPGGGDRAGVGAGAAGVEKEPTRAEGTAIDGSGRSRERLPRRPLLVPRSFRPNGARASCLGCGCGPRAHAARRLGGAAGGRHEDGSGAEQCCARRSGPRGDKGGEGVGFHATSHVAGVEDGHAGSHTSVPGASRRESPQPAAQSLRPSPTLSGRIRPRPGRRWAAAWPGEVHQRPRCARGRGLVYRTGADRVRLAASRLSPQSSSPQSTRTASWRALWPPRRRCCLSGCARECSEPPSKV